MVTGALPDPAPDLAALPAELLEPPAELVLAPPEPPEPGADLGELRVAKRWRDAAAGRAAQARRSARFARKLRRKREEKLARIRRHGNYVPDPDESNERTNDD